MAESGKRIARMMKADDKTMTLSLSQWIPVIDGENEYAVMAITDLPGLLVKKQENIAFGFKSMYDAVLCANAPAMYRCLDTCCALLSAFADVDDDLGKAYRYMDSLLDQITPRPAKSQPVEEATLEDTPF